MHHSMAGQFRAGASGLSKITNRRTDTVGWNVNWYVSYREQYLLLDRQLIPKPAKHNIWRHLTMGCQPIESMFPFREHIPNRLMCFPDVVPFIANQGALVADT